MQSMTCKKKPFGWTTRRVARSRFKTLRKAKNVESAYRAGLSVGFTAKSSLKSMGRIPRSTGCYELGAKYR